MKRNDRSFLKPTLAATVILTVVVLIFGFMAGKRQNVYICEVCPHNASVMYDLVGYYSDYIIIANDSDEDVNLENYGLSDDHDDLRKFVFPSVVIPAKGRLCVWAAIPDEINYDYIDADSLYTNFRLSDHESLYFTDPDGIVIDSLRLPNLKDDQAYLREAYGKKWQIATPSNLSETGFVTSDEIAVPVFSVPTGFYPQPFEVSITADAPDIFYTMDGSDPRTNGVLYTGNIAVYDRSEADNYLSALGPISLRDVYMPTEPVDKGTVFRAVARREDGAFSKEATATYFVGEEMRTKYLGTPILSVIVDPQDLFSHQDGIYVLGQVWDSVGEKAEELMEEQGEFFNTYLAPVNYNMRGKGWRRKADLELLDVTGKSMFQEGALISIRGNYTRYVNQKSFTLLPKDRTKIFDGLIAAGGNTLVIRTGGPEDMYATNFRDTVNNRIAQNLRIGSQSAICTQVFLNGEFWGCYNLQDRLDESFVAGRYGVDESNVILMKDLKILSGRKEDINEYEELKNFAAEYDFSNDLYYMQFCNMVDMDSLIDWYCAEMFFANDDVYDNNVAMWKVRTPGILPYEDGKWRFLLFDTDCSDAFRELSEASIDSFIEGHCRGYNPNEELYFSNLSKNPTFRKRFRERFLELLGTDFSFETTGPIVDEFEKIYEKPMVNSVRRFEDPNFTVENYHQSVEIVRNFFRERPGYLNTYIMQHMGD